MNLLDYLRSLARYQEWADAQMFYRWTQIQDPPEREKLLQLTHHIVMVQKLFLDAIETKEVLQPAKDRPLLPIPELKQLCRENHRRIVNYLHHATEEQLSNPISIPWFSSGFGLTEVDAISQVLLHTQHHRAQVLQDLARAADKAMVVDYIAWLYKSKPSARWE